MTIEIFDQLVTPVQAKAAGLQPQARVVLPYSQREKARQRATTECGEDVAITLPRGTIMRHGTLLQSPAGRYLLVEAAAEPVSTVSANERLVAIAYHLGNRHVALEVGEGWVRYLRDHVLDEMVKQLGGHLHHEAAPFEPEGGAYQGHHHHSHEHSHEHSQEHNHE